MNGRSTEACRRLASAVVDGRYLEDPEIWREHVAACPSCQELVDGLRTLRSRIDLATQRVKETGLPPESGEELIAEAFRRYRSLRRAQGLTLGIVLLVGLALGLVFLTRGGPEPEPVSVRTYAATLHDRVFGENAPPDYELLQRDASLRTEYLAALDHESSLVRRVAVQALLFSGVPLEPARIEAILTTWDESLDEPLEVASTEGGRRHLEDALARRREATLVAVLSGAGVRGARGGAPVASAVIEPYVDHPAHGVRASALRALAVDPTYRPGERVLRRLRVEDDREAAKFAASLVIGRLGDEGREAVVARLRESPDWGLEGFVVHRLGDAAESVLFSRERVLDAGVPPRIGLEHLHRLERLGEALPTRDALLARALHDDDPRSWEALARYAAPRDLLGLREGLQQRWKACRPGPLRSRLARYLVDWDCACGEEGRQRLALDILEVDRSASLRPYAERLATSEHPAVRTRAQDLLAEW